MRYWWAVCAVITNRDGTRMAVRHPVRGEDVWYLVQYRDTHAGQGEWRLCGYASPVDCALVWLRCDDR